MRQDRQLVIDLHPGPQELVNRSVRSAIDRLRRAFPGCGTPRAFAGAVPAAEAAGPDLVAEAVQRFGAVRVKVHGSSMLPAIQPGDVLQVRRSGGHPSPGAVVLFRRDGRLVAHRVLAHTPDGHVVTRGDALASPDAPVRADDVIGVVDTPSSAPA